MQGLQVVAQNEMIIGVPSARSLIETNLPSWFSTLTSGSDCAEAVKPITRASIKNKNFFIVVNVFS
jgi:hypothetical protein